MSEEIKKERQSNIELLRLLSMIMVLIVHANFLALGCPGKADLLASPMSSSIRIFIQALCNVCVDVFVLISGWFGIKFSFKGIANIIFQCIFFTALALGAMLLFDPNGIKWSLVIKSFWFGSSYWFVPAYLGLVVLSPVLNKFVETADRRIVKVFLISFFIFEMIYGWISLDEVHFINGYSCFSFILLYILSRYVNTHKPQFSLSDKRRDLLMYIVSVLLVGGGTIMVYLFANSTVATIVRDKMFAYNNPLCIVGAISLLLFFSKFNLGSKCWINLLSISTFAIFLIHSNPLILPKYVTYFKNLFDSFGYCNYMAVGALSVLFIALMCILIDKLRMRFWNAILKLSNK